MRSLFPLVPSMHHIGAVDVMDSSFVIKLPSLRWLAP
jgi:hypothetical protein